MEAGIHHSSDTKGYRIRNNKDQKNKGKVIKCFKYEKNGHFDRECRSLIEKDRVECYKCHKKGHYAKECHFIDDVTKKDRDEYECHNITDVFSINGKSMGASLTKD